METPRDQLPGLHCSDLPAKGKIVISNAKLIEAVKGFLRVRRGRHERGWLG